jgi:DNA-binding transcriptional ArsR family regulator
MNRTTRSIPRARRARPAPTRQRRDDARDVEQLARNFRALGDPTRSRMVLALCGGERCVSELADVVGLSLSATSHQLRILRDLDLVRVRKAGRQQFYALNEPAFGFCSPRSCQAWRSLVPPDGPSRG